jgi:hypothetical protein
VAAQSPTRPPEEGDDVTWYVIVTRDKQRTPISRHVTIEDAGNRIYRERTFDRHTVVAQDGDRAAGPARELTTQEKLRLEKCLYPSLYE